jgi:hypothetical protein
VQSSGDTGIGGGAPRPGTFARLCTGRLVEVRIERFAGLPEVESLCAAVLAAVRSAGPGAVLCADHRRAVPVPGELANALSRAMRNVNRSVGRSAILLHPENMTFNLQLERIVQCAGGSVRRVFTDPSELHEWLEGELTEVERGVLRALLSDGRGD